MSEKQTRRRFLQAAGVGAAASLIQASPPQRAWGRSQQAAGKEQVRGALTGQRLFELGLASYTLREFKLDETLAMTRRLGLKYICFKSSHLPLESTEDEIKAVAAKVKEAGLTLYGGGVIYMNNDAEVHRAFEYAKAAGMKIIIAMPKYELLPLVNKKVQEYDIKLAIHNHGPGDKNYPTPATAYERIKDLDRRVGLCHDIGHTMRAGVDPCQETRKVADRLLDVHMKDVSEATAKGHAVEIGRGVIDIPKFLATLLEIKYAGVVAFEYEKDANDPLPGLAESVGYVRGVLASI
jgi:inosose dehydratase